MRLNYRKIGSGYPLIILHGLYGSGDNWLTIGKSLAGISEVYLIDQRNHGDSPHDERHDYEAMMQDLKEFMHGQGIDKAIIMGHSMGGKVAMSFAMEYPYMVSRLIIVDISPGSYLDGEARGHLKLHRGIISGMMNLDTGQVQGLADADSQLAEHIPDDRLRKFLMKNLGKDDNGRYYWKINLNVLMENLEKLSDGLDEEKMKDSELSSFPVLFIKGENSDYIGEDDQKVIKEIFPLSNIVTIKNAGHWLHAEYPGMFTRIVKRFILSY